MYMYVLFKPLNCEAHHGIESSEVILLGLFINHDREIVFHAVKVLSNQVAAAHEFNHGCQLRELGDVVLDNLL